MKMKTQHIRICGIPLKQYLGEICMTEYACIRKISQINDLHFYLKKLKSKLNQSSQKRGNGIDQCGNYVQKTEKQEIKSLKPKTASLGISVKWIKF